MEQHFRIALWMFCLVGYLQAKAIPTEHGVTRQKPCYHFNIDDLGFDYLLEDVSCDKHVTFTTPTNVLEKSHATALALFIEGLEQANKKCSDEQKRTTEIKHTLEIPLQKLKSLQHANSTEFQRENKTFAAFVKDLESFLKQLNDNPKMC